MTDEVLVHISTPATRQNDELFRYLANAYTAFQPCQIYCDELVRKRAKINQTAGLDPEAHPTRMGGSVIREADNPSIPTTSKESYGSFPSSISSDGYYHDQDPVSANDGSMYSISRLAQLDRSYLSWRERATPRSSFTHGQRETPNSSSGPEDADTGFIEDSQSALQALQSQLQDTYSTTSEDTCGDDERQDDNAGAAEKQSSRIVSPVQSQYSGPNKEVQLPVLPEDEARTYLRGRLLNDSTSRSTYTIGASQSKVHIGVDQLDFSTLPVVAFPPAPTISIACPGSLPSQITKHLAAIKTKNPDRFEPLEIRRTLDTDERGYWLVNCVQWSTNLQWEFWSLLYEHVCNGRIGWGTTLHREHESGHTIGRVRLYCWGEVVEHMWLLLWLCSKGKILDSGSSWVDANGVAVLEL